MHMLSLDVHCTWNESLYLTLISLAIPLCPQGHYAVSGTTCAECGPGTFQPDQNSDSCMVSNCVLQLCSQQDNLLAESRISENNISGELYSFQPLALYNKL